MARTYGKFSDLITFTRASGGTALRPIGYGSELVTNGDFSDGAAGWSISGESTISAGVAVIYSSSGTVTKIRQIGFPVNKTLSITYTIKNYVAGGLNLGASGSYQVIPSTVGTHTVLMKTNSGELEINRQGGPTIITIDNISVKEVLFDQPNAPLTLFNHPVDIPRIEYDADGNRLGLLIEEARTNFLLRSNEFNTSWSIYNSSLGVNAAVAPDGTLSGEKIITNAAAANGQVFQSVVKSASAITYTSTVFAKAGEWDTIGIFVSDSTTFTNRADINVNLVTGNFTSLPVARGAFTAGSGTVSSVGNGWLRISLTFTTATETGLFNRIYSLDSVATTGDGTSGIYIWGAQLEVGSFPTSYIPTGGSTATRAADSASIPVSEFGYNDDEGTVFIDVKFKEQPGSNLRVIDNSNTQRWIYINNPDDNTYPIKYYDGTNNVTFYTASDQNVKIALSVTPVAATGAVNGSGGVSGSHNGSLLDISQFKLLFNVNGHIKSIKYYPRALTNAQLQDLTT